MNLPGLWVSRSSGKKIKEAFANAPVISGKMRVNTLYEYRDAFNISGRLEGSSEDFVLVHSHHDAVFEPRLFYVSTPKLHDFTYETVKHYDLDKSIIALVPTGEGLDKEYVFRQDEVISDAFYFNESGVPVVSHVCGEQYLFHISDRPDRIPVDELKPVGMAFAEIAEKAMEIL